MGYELDRLMNQFGVSTPSLSYSGMNKPIDPGAYKYVPPAEGTTGGATDAEQRANYDALLTKYNVDTPRYTADRAAFDTYKQQYQNQLRNTPQYLQNQYNTLTSTPSTAPTFSPASRAATAPGGIGIDQMNRNIQAAYQSNPNATPAQIADAQRVSGSSNRDLRNALGSAYGQPAPSRGSFDATGNYWSSTLKPPSYAAETPGPAPLNMGTVKGIQFPTNIVSLSPTEKASYYNTLLSQGYTDSQIRTALNAPLDSNWIELQRLATQSRLPATSTTPATTAWPTTTVNVNGVTFPSNIVSQTPQQKADYYNTLLAQGQTDAGIRAAIGNVPDADWNYLRSLAAASRAPTAPVTPSVIPSAAVATPTPVAPVAQVPSTVATPAAVAAPIVTGGMDDPNVGMAAPVTTAPVTPYTPPVTPYTPPVTVDTYVPPAPVEEVQTTYGGIQVPSDLLSRSPQGKADYYKSLRQQGWTDEGIRTALGAPADSNWQYLTQLAGYAKGGSVKKHFADGGLNDLADQYGVAEAPAQMMFAGADQPERGYAAPQLKPPTQAPERSVPMNEQGQLDLPALLAKYQPQQSMYGDEYKAAREAAARETAAFQDMLKKAIEGQQDNGPSKSEMYFRLAAAFGAPTKTAGLGEALGRSAEVMGQYGKEQREARKASQQQALQLGLQGEQARMTAAKEDLASLRQMAGEEMKDKRTITAELIKDYVASGKPQSSAGKQALDEGLVQGTPAYQKRVAEISNMNIDRQMAQINATIAQMSVAQANLALAQGKFQFQQQQGAKLTPTEMKLKSETEDLLGGLDASLTALTQAYKLNPTTFDNSLPDLAQRKILEAAGSKDPKVINTRLQENLLQEKALAGLKAAFGSNPTEGERAILLQVQGIGAKSKEERAQIMQNAYRQLKTKREAQAKRLNEIKQGLYRDTTAAVEGIE